MKRRPRPPPPVDGLTDAEAAALERAVSPPGWRMDGPEFDWCQEAAEQLLAARWRRRVAASLGDPPRRSP